MDATKRYFYKPHKDMPDIYVGLDIPQFMRDMRKAFHNAALENLDPDTKLPDGPVYYADKSRSLHWGRRLEDVMTECLRYGDEDNAAKRELAETIAQRAADDRGYRERMVAYNRVPQSWAGMLLPDDPEEEPDKVRLAEAFNRMQDRDYSDRNNAKGRYHPLVRIVDTVDKDSFPDSAKLAFIADYMMGRKHRGEAPDAVRIGPKGNYTEYVLGRWLEQNKAYILRTVGDVLKLKEHFTAAGKLRSNPPPPAGFLPHLKPR